MVRGKPARCGRLVIAIAITVPERSLNTSWLRTRLVEVHLVRFRQQDLDPPSECRPSVFRPFFKLHCQAFLGQSLLVLRSSFEHSSSQAGLVNSGKFLSDGFLNRPASIWKSLGFYKIIEPF